MRGVLGNDRRLDSPEKILKEALLHKSIIHILLIIIVGLIAYSNTFNVPFQFDDIDNIVENYKLKDLSNFWPPSGSRWFGFLTFALNYKLGGLDTTGYHLVNIVIHIFNAILIYWLVALTFRTPYFKVSVISASVSNQPNQFNLSTFKPLNCLPLFIALIFVSHPIQTQAVTYIVQRFTSLATMLYLLSLVMYIKWRLSYLRTTNYELQTRRLKPAATRYTLYAVSLISAILAMKTKEISFTLPVVIALYEFMFFEGKSKKRLLYLNPLLLTMLIIPLSLVGINKPVGDAIGELMDVAQETGEIPRWSYLFTQFKVILTYIRLLFLPINQNVDYDYPIYHSFFESDVFLSFLFILLAFAFAIYLFYTKRYSLSASRLMAFGIFWFFITLSVESSIIPIVDVIFEHRLYLPTVGVFIAITTSVFILASKLKRKWPQIEKTVTPVLALIIIILSSATYARNIVWQDEVRLWEDVVKKSPNKARGYNNIGDAYRDKGWVDKAIEHYHIALRLKPDFVKAYNNLGVGYFKQGRLAEAIQAYHIALRLKPDFPKAHYNLGLAYHDQGRLDEAIQAYHIALRLKPDFVEAHYNIGLAYHDQGRLAEAIQAYHIALRLKPDFVEAHYNLGLTYGSQGRLDEAIQEYKIALRLKPDFAKAHNNLGIVYGKKGMIDEAIQAFQTALKLKPDFAEAHNNLGIVYGKKGMIDEAIQAFQTALKLKPDCAEIHNNLGVVYEKKGLLDEAIKEYEMALRLNPNDIIARNNLNRILQMKKK